MNQKLLDEINEKLKAVMAQSPAADLERNLRAMLGSAFARLDLVSREEFDIQREVLARTRARLAELERQVAAMEAADSPACKAPSWRTCARTKSSPLPRISSWEKTTRSVQASGCRSMAT